MKIAFVASGTVPFHGRSLEERPLGGIETAVIRLAEALSKLNIDVVVVTPHENPPLSDPIYIPHRAVSDLGDIDLLISVREWSPLLLKLGAKRRFFWTGDAPDQLATVGIGDKRIIESIDGIFAVSHWQATELSKQSGYPLDKIQILPNGVYLPDFAVEEPREPKRLIYSSTPFRGLAYLPAIVTSLRESYPELECHIFSGFAVYEGAKLDPSFVKSFDPLFKLVQRTPGCILRGNVKQAVLAREYKRSSILAYPNTFPETSCITALEAQAAGCPIVTSNLGALPETVGDAGILISEPPGSKEYLVAFTKAIASLLDNKDEWSKLSSNGLNRSRNASWDLVASNFINWLKDTGSLA